MIVDTVTDLISARYYKRWLWVYVMIKKAIQTRKGTLHLNFVFSKLSLCWFRAGWGEPITGRKNCGTSL